MEEERNVNMETRAIPFTQYMRPNGARALVWTSHDTYTDEDLKAAQAIIDVGFVFEIEVLSNGMVSMTISDKDGDYAAQITSNTPDNVPATIKKLVHMYDLETLMAARDRLAEDGEGDFDA